MKGFIGLVALVMVASLSAGATHRPHLPVDEVSRKGGGRSRGEVEFKGQLDQPELSEAFPAWDETLTIQRAECEEKARVALAPEWRVSDNPFDNFFGAAARMTANLLEAIAPLQEAKPVVVGDDAGDVA